MVKTRKNFKGGSNSNNNIDLNNLLTPNNLHTRGFASEVREQRLAKEAREEREKLQENPFIINTRGINQRIGPVEQGKKYSKGYVGSNFKPSQEENLVKDNKNVLCRYFLEGHNLRRGSYGSELCLGNGLFKKEGEQFKRDVLDLEGGKNEVNLTNSFQNYLDKYEFKKMIKLINIRSCGLQEYIVTKDDAIIGIYINPEKFDSLKTTKELKEYLNIPSFALDDEEQFLKSIKEHSGKILGVKKLNKFSTKNQYENILLGQIISEKTNGTYKFNVIGKVEENDDLTFKFKYLYGDSDCGLCIEESGIPENYTSSDLTIQHQDLHERRHRGFAEDGVKYLHDKAINLKIYLEHYKKPGKSGYDVQFKDHELNALERVFCSEELQKIRNNQAGLLNSPTFHVSKAIQERSKKRSESNLQTTKNRIKQLEEEIRDLASELYYTDIPSIRQINNKGSRPTSNDYKNHLYRNLNLFNENNLRPEIPSILDNKTEAEKEEYYTELKNLIKRKERIEKTLHNLTKSKFNDLDLSTLEQEKRRLQRKLNLNLGYNSNNSNNNLEKTNDENDLKELTKVFVEKYFMKQGINITDSTFDIDKKIVDLRKKIDTETGIEKRKKEKEVKFLKEYQEIDFDVLEMGGGSRKKVCSSTQGPGNRRRSKRCNPKSKGMIYNGRSSRRRSRKGRKRNSKKRR